MAYTATVTLDTPHDERISRNLGILVGKCVINPYHTTGAEITDITGQFKTLLRVITDGFSTNGYMVRWNTTDKCFHAYYPTQSHGESYVDENLAGTEAANDDDIGEVNFVAIGLV